MTSSAPAAGDAGAEWPARRPPARGRGVHWEGDSGIRVSLAARHGFGHDEDRAGRLRPGHAKPAPPGASQRARAGGGGAGRPRRRARRCGCGALRRRPPDDRLPRAARRSGSWSSSACACRPPPMPTWRSSSSGRGGTCSWRSRSHSRRRTASGSAMRHARPGCTRRWASTCAGIASWRRRARSCERERSAASCCSPRRSPAMRASAAPGRTPSWSAASTISTSGAISSGARSWRSQRWRRAATPRWSPHAPPAGL